ncbi:hypothetical protein SISSUDRAFT_1058391 [Sistotremastrum suecicum HHB10207 ss-3]|uniref:Uncharacterized protein n=1 Tax=Sistotremastrum suecicum HHB10207 ss-3 TaxID=1314776 RepID=A0A166HE50_9AGAM|nr:hypothetical protein SISSUDRAFT_1058391 [Sistotremastrum suecicum HHB10207 ss-3]
MDAAAVANVLLGPPDQVLSRTASMTFAFMWMCISILTHIFPAFQAKMPPPGPTPTMRRTVLNAYQRPKPHSSIEDFNLLSPPRPPEPRRRVTFQVEASVQCPSPSRSPQLPTSQLPVFTSPVWDQTSASGTNDSSSFLSSDFSNNIASSSGPKSPSLPLSPSSTKRHSLDSQTRRTSLPRRSPTMHAIGKLASRPFKVRRSHTVSTSRDIRGSTDESTLFDSDSHPSSSVGAPALVGSESAPPIDSGFSNPRSSPALADASPERRPSMTSRSSCPTKAMLWKRPRCSLDSAMDSSSRIPSERPSSEKRKSVDGSARRLDRHEISQRVASGIPLNARGS